MSEGLPADDIRATVTPKLRLNGTQNNSRDDDEEVGMYRAEEVPKNRNGSEIVDSDESEGDDAGVFLIIDIVDDTDLSDAMWAEVTGRHPVAHRDR